MIGQQPRTGRVADFYGRDTLERIVDSGDALSLSVLQVRLDFSQSSDEPEQLAELCVQHKGRCDFE